LNNSVLIIDDDRTSLSVLQTLLKIEGYQVSTLPNGYDFNQIITAIHQEKPNFIILDVHLKSMNGIEIVRHLRKSNVYYPKILMISGKAVKELCIEAGADRFLLKPYMPNEIISFLKSQGNS